MRPSDLKRPVAVQQSLTYTKLYLVWLVVVFPSHGLQSPFTIPKICPSFLKNEHGAYGILSVFKSLKTRPQTEPTPKGVAAFYEVHNIISLGWMFHHLTDGNHNQAQDKIFKLAYELNVRSSGSIRVAVVILGKAHTLMESNFLARLMFPVPSSPFYRPVWQKLYLWDLGGQEYHFPVHKAYIAWTLTPSVQTACGAVLYS